MVIKDIELLKVYGGQTNYSSFINTAIRLFGFVLEFGKTVGSTIRRGKTKNYCSG